MKRFLSVFLVVIIILSAASCDFFQSATIQFETFGGTLIDDHFLPQGSTITKPQPPIKDGYAFIGWYSNNTLWNFNEVVNDDITLYAKWRENSYKLEHYKQDASGTGYMLFATENLAGDIDVNVTAAPAAYIGFQENTSYASRIPSGIILSDGSLVLKLYYDRNTYTVTFNSNEGSTVSPVSSVHYGAGITEPTAPIKTGYTFSGWFKEAELSTGWDFTHDMVTESSTLFAKWAPSIGTAYKLEHYQQNVSGTDYTLFATEDLTGITETTATAKAAEYLRFQKNTSHPLRIPSGTILSDGSLVLRLYYDRNTYTVTYNSTEGSAVSSDSSVRYGARITEPAAPTKPGYIFSDWWVEFFVAWDFDTDTVTSDKTLYAKWAPSIGTAYKLEHYQQDVSGTGYTLVSTENLTGITEKTVIAVTAAYPGFEENTGHPLRIPSGTILSDGSLVLKLYYDRNTYTVTYNSTEGSAVSSDSSVRYGARITEPAAPTKPGYIFSDWWVEFFVAWDFDTDTVTTDKTLYAKWAPSIGTAYKLEHYQQDVSGTGYTLVSTENLTGTSEATVIAVAAAYPGFEENTGHASRVLNGTILGDGSLVLKLYYDRNTHTVSYNSNEGSAVSPVTSVRYGAGIPAPAAPTKSDYPFLGWFNEAELSTDWDFTTDTVTADITLYAKWAPFKARIINTNQIEIYDVIKTETEVIIPDKIDGKSVTSIGDKAFYSCPDLTSITIPDSVTSIGQLAFFLCTELTSITFPDGVTSIGDRAFYKCYGLTSITIGNSVTSIGPSAFSACTSLTSITIPNNVTSIESSAFSGCSKLTSITLPDNITSIASSTFSGCTKLTDITIPDSVTSIGDRAFYMCYSLTSITIPDSVTSIGGSAFSSCVILPSITIPDSVTSMGSNVFTSNCYKLTSINCEAPRAPAGWDRNWNGSSVIPNWNSAGI